MTIKSLKPISLRGHVRLGVALRDYETPRIAAKDLAVRRALEAAGVVFIR